MKKKILTKPFGHVSIGSKHYVVEVAMDDQSRYKGLSKRHNLDEGLGMLIYMTDLSIVIPARNEEFLSKTIQCLLENMDRLLITYQMFNHSPLDHIHQKRNVSLFWKLEGTI